MLRIWGKRCSWLIYFQKLGYCTVILFSTVNFSRRRKRLDSLFVSVLHKGMNSCRCFLWSLQASPLPSRLFYTICISRLLDERNQSLFSGKKNKLVFLCIFLDPYVSFTFAIPSTCFTGPCTTFTFQKTAITKKIIHAEMYFTPFTTSSLYHCICKPIIFPWQKMLDPILCLLFVISLCIYVDVYMG